VPPGRLRAVEARRHVGARFICLEGPDGAGKSRAVKALADHLREGGRSVTVTREPGGTRLGELVRGILLDSGPTERGPQADAMLFSAARSQLVHEVIRPALARGEIVISDRFAPSTLAYQGYGSGLDLEMLHELEAFATAGVRPDLVILLDVPVSVGLARRSRGEPAQVTRFEDPARHDEGFHERVRQGYLAMARTDPDRWRVLDADRPVRLVEGDLLDLVDRELASNEPKPSLPRIRA
jgi:dTMP kinase